MSASVRKTAVRQRHWTWLEACVAVVAVFVAGSGAGGAFGLYRWHDRYHHGCGRDSKDDEIVMVSGADIGVQSAQHDAIKQWNDYARAHNKMLARRVTIPGGTDQERAQMLAEQQIGSCSYDVLTLDVVWIPEFIRAGYLEPFPPNEFDSKKFLDKPWQAGTDHGRQYVIPSSSDVGLLYYRKDLIPHPPRTWGELRHMTTKAYLGKLHGKEPPGGLATQLADYEGLTVNGMEAIWRAGGDIKVEKDTGRIVVDQAAANGLNQLIGGVGSLPILKESTEFREDDSVAAFTAGQVLFLRNWPYAYSVIAADPFFRKRRFGVTELPGPAPGTPGSGALGGHGLAVPKNARHKKEARELIEFLSKPDQQEQGFACGTTVPVIKDAYKSANIKACSQLPGQKQPSQSEDGNPVSRQQLLDLARTLKRALKNAKLRADVLDYPNAPDYSDFSRAFHRYIHDAMDQDTTINANQLSEQLTACAGGIASNSDFECP